jgi:hypothetical protein
MPTLVYPTADFQPFTKILSSEVNGKFNAIKTLLNTTKLDSTNVQQNGLSWNRLTTQTSLQVAVTDTLGQLTTSAFITTAQGGTGLAYTATTLDVGKVLQVNTAGTALTFSGIPGAATNMYQYSRFL